MMSGHALLSPSASHRWMLCTPSARLTEFIADETSAFAQEGTLAHAVAEEKLNFKLGYTDKEPNCQDEEMNDYTDDYVSFVIEQAQVLNNPTIYVEQRVDCSRYVPECFGTCDALIVSDDVLHLCDLKYGMGVKVDAEENDQLKIYALGAISIFGDLYDFKKIKMSIFQPRIGNCSTWEISIEDLLKWAENTLVPAATLAWNGEGEYVSGEHCRFCKAKAQCRKRAEDNLALAVHDFTDPVLLEAIEIAEILFKIDELVSWGSDVKEFALKSALGGTKYEGWKLVEGRSNRNYINDDVVADAVIKFGADPYEKKLLGVTAMQKLLGKTKFNEVLSPYIEKPAGKPTLVLSSDKRQEISINTAAMDFDEMPSTERKEEN